QRGTCTISGDPHYYTFDGTVFHFQGTCTYVLSEKCGLGLPYYRVEGENEHRGSTHVSWTRLVKVYVYNETIELVKGHRAKAKDDFRTRQGEVVSSDVDFANSWQATGNNDTVCEAKCGGLACAACTDDQTALYSNTDHCGILQNSSGPFASCHQQLSPKPFVESCVFDLCVGEGYQPILCQALNVYASQCQQNGVQLPRCPATCVNPNSTQNCPLPAQESCICNAGYTLSAGVCVPHSECGCSFEGRYYRSGETVILDEDCGRRCSCSHGSMTCHSHGCGPLESCKVEEGERSCRPSSYASCWIRGPGSYHTFDGLTYQYPGACRITIVNNNSYFHLTKVDGQRIGLPFSSPSSRIKIYQSSVHSIILRTSFDILTSSFTLFMTLNLSNHCHQYSGKTCGLCGNFNGNQNDDFQTPSGMAVSTPDEFGTSWKVAGNYTCSDGCGSSCPQCTNELPARAQCEVIQAADGPFSFCHEQVDPAPYFNDCVFDVCVSENRGKDLLCRDIQAYVSACQSANVQIYPWRQNTTCSKPTTQCVVYLSCKQPKNLTNKCFEIKFSIKTTSSIICLLSY
uniref:VWFD domain-containing protein n=1 Tax=Sparus aurata TaxID=8175 RepID=A0A671TVG0_SPAAU